MTKKLSFLLIIPLFGCTPLASQGSNTQEAKTTPPAHIIIQQGQTQLIGTPLSGVIVAHDTSNEGLPHTWNEEVMNVEGRDFETSLTYLSLPSPPDFRQNITPQNPIINQTLSWFGRDEKIEQGTVISLKPNANYPNTPVIITLSSTHPYQSIGSPLFDIQGDLYGIIIGGDSTSHQLFALRIQDVVSFIKENI